jgi:hypothetical protein
MNRSLLTDEEDKDSIHELLVQLLFEEDQYERATLNSPPQKKTHLKIHQRQGGNSVLHYPARAKTVCTHNHHNYTRILEQPHCYC